MAQDDDNDEAVRAAPRPMTRAAVGTVAVMTADAASAADAYLQSQIEVLKKRVADLEAGVPPVEPPIEPPDYVETPNLTTVLAGSDESIIDHVGNVWEIGPSRRVVINGVPDATTSNVELLAKCDPSVWQTVGGRWWSKLADEKPPTAPWVGEPAPPPGVELPEPPEPVIPPTGSAEVAQFNPGSPRPSVASGSNVVTANVSEKVGAFCCKGLFSVATQGFCNYNPGNCYNQELDAGDSSVLRAAYGDLGLRLVRMNGLSLVSDAYGDNIDRAPNFARVDKLISGFGKTFPQAELMVCFGQQKIHGAYADANLRQRFANAVRDIVRRFEAGGLHIKYIEAINEPNQPGGPSPENMRDVEARIRAQIKPLFPHIELVGPQSSYAQQNYIQASAANCDSIAYNRYDRNPGGDNFGGGNQPPLNDAQLYANSINQADDIGRVRAWARAVRPADYKIFKTEYFMDWYPFGSNFNPATGKGNDVRQQNYKGAVYCALTAIAHAYGGLSGAQLWRLEFFDGQYGPFNKSAFPQLNPCGSFLKAGAQYLGGQCVPFTIASTTTNKLLGMATNDGTNVGLCLVNYDAGNSYNGGRTNVTWNGTISLPGRESAAGLSRWMLNEGRPTGMTDSCAMEGNSLSVSLPSESILILHGAR